MENTIKAVAEELAAKAKRLRTEAGRLRGADCLQAAQAVGQLVKAEQAAGKALVALEAVLAGQQQGDGEA